MIWGIPKSKRGIYGLQSTLERATLGEGKINTENKVGNGKVRYIWGWILDILGCRYCESGSVFDTRAISNHPPNPETYPYFFPVLHPCPLNHASISTNNPTHNHRDHRQWTGFGYTRSCWCYWSDSSWLPIGENYEETGWNVGFAGTYPCFPVNYAIPNEVICIYRVRDLQVINEAFLDM
jgi:hypothetical protein